MEPSIYRYILRYTKKDQILILLLTAVSLPLVYMTLEVPKLIINDAIGGSSIPDSLFGFPIGQLDYLIFLCSLFLALVLANGAMKYLLNVYRGVIGERMLRRLRYDLFCRILRFPRSHIKTVSAGETVPIITAETEPLGGFIGEAFALPAFQGGILLTYLFFIFNQDIVLGLFATALYPFQLYVIPRLQRSVNELGKKRVLAARKLGDRIGEVIAGIDEIRSHDTSRYERAVISERLGRIFDIRFEIYKKKFFIKFLNNFLAQVTPFFFYLFGGYFIITGRLSLGAMVAILAAYKDLSSPWKELLKYYQTKEDVRIKYEQIIRQFSPRELLESDDRVPEPFHVQPGSEGWFASNVGYSEEESLQLLERLNFRLDLTGHAAIVGDGNNGKEILGHLLTGLIYPTEGQLSLSGRDIRKLPRQVLGRRLSHIGAQAHLFPGSIRENLEYGLRHEPRVEQSDYTACQRKKMKTAMLAGNSQDDPAVDWIGLTQADRVDSQLISNRMLEILKVTGLYDDIFQLGFFGRIANPQSDLANQVLEGRRYVAGQLKDNRYDGLVELFDINSYNKNISVLENLLFSPLKDQQHNLDELSHSPVFREFLHRHGLLDVLVRAGRELTEIMIDVFSDIDIDADGDLFHRFSLIQAERLPHYKALLEKHNDLPDTGFDSGETASYLRLAFQLTPGRHRLGIINDEIQRKIVQARRALIGEAPEIGVSLHFFDRDTFHPDLNLMDNILYGKLVYGEARAEKLIHQLIRDAVNQLAMQKSIAGVGLGFNVGTGGRRLSAAQRQKLAIARGLMKDPLVLILNDATSSLDPASEQRLLKRLRIYLRGRGLIFITGNSAMAREFDRVYSIKHGTLIEMNKSDNMSSKLAVPTA